MHPPTWTATRVKGEAGGADGGGGAGGSKGGGGDGGGAHGSGGDGGGGDGGGGDGGGGVGGGGGAAGGSGGLGQLTSISPFGEGTQLLSWEYCQLEARFGHAGLSKDPLLM